MKFFKDLLNLFQVISVFMIPIAVCQRTFPEIAFFNFVKPFNDAAIAIFSLFAQNFIVSGVDLTLIFVALPWVIYIVLAGMIINLLEGLTHKIDEEIVSYRKKKVQEINIRQQEQQVEQLQKKLFSYLAINLVFSKFTISSLSESEIQAKKNEIKTELIGDLNATRGKLLDEEEFDDENTFAMLFFSQEDAISYVLKIKEQIRILDNDMQEYGYSLGYKAIIDVQQPEAIRFYILEFLEKCLNAVELNETCTTSDFATRYKAFGKMKNITFTSKGNYSINKERVELQKLEY